jgi:hypothetical protein
MYQKYLLQTSLGEQVCIIRTSDNAHISSDETHPDWVTYQAWVADGNTAEEWNPDAITEPVVQPTAEPETTTESVES